MTLFKLNLRLVHRLLCVREILPPLFALLCLAVFRQLLAMNADRLLPKLRCVIFDHLFPSLMLYVSFSF